MDYNKYFLLNLNRLYYLNIFINKIIIENKYSLVYIYNYIKYYNKILKIVNKNIINSKFLYKDVKNVKNSYVHNYIMEVIPPKNLKIYEYIINHQEKIDNAQKYQYIDGLDIIIYRKKNKIRDNLLFLIYQTSYKGLRKNRVYDISKNLELLNYEFYINIYNLFYTHNNIYYTRGFLTYENNELYKMEKLFILFKNNEVIKEKLIYKYLFVYDFQNILIELNISNNNFIKLSNANNESEYISYISDKKHFIFLNCKKKKLINKSINDNKILLDFNNISIYFKKIFPIIYYNIDNYVYLHKKNDKYKIFNYELNVHNVLNIDMCNIYIHEYNIYITNSNFIKILINYKMIDKNNIYLIKKLNINYLDETISSGFNKILHYKQFFNNVHITNKTPYDILSIVYDLSNYNFEKNIYYIIETNEFCTNNKDYNNLILEYNHIYNYLNI